MKKITTLAAIAAVAGLASCTAQAPKANRKQNSIHCLIQSVWLRLKV